VKSSELISRIEDSFYKGAEAYSEMVINHFRVMATESNEIKLVDVINRLQLLADKVLVQGRGKFGKSEKKG